MITKIKENIFQLHFKEFGSCVYLIRLKDKNIVIDTSSEINRSGLIQSLSSLKMKPEDIDIVLLTHSHPDHTGNIGLFKNAEIYSEKNISQFPVKEIEIIKTPGHTEDSLCFFYHRVLFSGDTIFHDGGRGRTDLEGGSESEILKSIAKLSKVRYKILCPGHI